MQQLDQQAADTALPSPSAGTAFVGFVASTASLIFTMLVLGGIA
ncbi:hypothetical protein [Methylobacterium oryzisoli]